MPSSGRGLQALQVKLAEQLTQLQEGQRLPSIRELAKATHMSVGSVSAALNELRRLKAVEIQHRGHLGASVTRLNWGMLWKVIAQGPLVVALTLPMHRRFEGLATAIKIGLEKAGVETYSIFVRGSTTRLKALSENRCHVTVLSGFAAAQQCGRTNEVILELPPTSWVSQYCIFYRTLKPARKRLLRVAVDQTSSDHQQLTDLVFAGQKIERVSVSYVQVAQRLRSGEVDATIWNSDQADSFLSADVHMQPISAAVMTRLGVRSTAAALVARAGDRVVRALIRATIHPDEVIAIQNKISAGELIPTY